MLYKSLRATEPQIVKAEKYRDFLSVNESKDETGKSYAYLCQRQVDCSYEITKFGQDEWVEDYIDDTDFESFIMAEDIFNACYLPLEEREL
jgi:hypothetical protein